VTHAWVGLADTILVVHLAYIAFIPLGGVLVWRWPRVVWAHLAAVAIGIASITIGFDCPLTTWEQSLRRRGGQHPYTNGFVDHYLTGHVYPHGYDSAVQVIFCLCIVATYAYALRQAHDRARVRGATRVDAARRAPTRDDALGR
jgi:hypothetical protein